MTCTKETLNELLEKTVVIMTRLKKGGIQVTAPITIVDFDQWEWPQGVGLYGLFKYYQETGSQETLEHITGWFERKLRGELPGKNVNTMAPMLALAHLYELTGNPLYRERCSEWAEWVMHEMPRTRDGGLQHIVTGHANPQQLWDDTLYMTVLFLAKIGILLGRQDYIEESIRQFLVHIKYLYDKKTGLWFHGWTFLEKSNFASALWARGNAWITAGMVDYIEMVGLEGGVKNYLIDTLANQVEALAGLQDASGLWHTLLDDPSSYLETSASAGFGYGILKGVRKGYLDAKHLPLGLRALDGVIGQIAPDGTVLGVSYGTGMGWDLEQYRQVSICPMAYGQALTILLLNEAMKL